jgi:hypothetical protein
MSVWDDMARDAGYQGDEAKQVAAMLEEGERERTLGPLCDYSGHDWADAGGGLEICMACQAERWADETPSRGQTDASGRQERRPQRAAGLAGHQRPPGASVA